MIQSSLFRITASGKSCRCISTAATACRTLVRPATIATGISKIRFKHLTTLFYSTVLATAAAADVRAKERRRTQWDKVIAEAEHELVDTRGHHDEDKTPHLSVPFMGTGERDLLGAYDSMGGLNLDALHSADISVQDLKDEVFRALDGRDSTSSSAPWYTRHGPHSVYATNSEKSGLERWTPKKLLTVEYSVALLATNLLLAVSAPTADTTHPIGGVSDGDTGKRRADLSATRERLTSTLAAIKSKSAFNVNEIERLQYPQYLPIYNREDRATTTFRLNVRLLRLFRRHALRGSELNEVVLGLVHELLTSPHPPDHRTYTLVINRFSRLGHHALVDLVIESLYQSHIRFNELTVADILTHYNRKRDYASFSHFVGKMKGHYGGFMLAHPRTTPATAANLRRGNKIIQPIAFDPRIYSALIKGYLSFGNFHHASMWYSNMRKQGILPDVRLMGDFLLYYAHYGSAGDWKNGLITWSRIKRRLHHCKNRSEVLDFYRRAILLCRNKRKPRHQVAINEEALGKGFTHDELANRLPAIKPSSPEAETREPVRRRLWVLEQQLSRLQDELRSFHLQLAASRVILEAQSVNHVYETLSDMSMREKQVIRRQRIKHNKQEGRVYGSVVRRISAARRHLIKGIPVTSRSNIAALASERKSSPGSLPPSSQGSEEAQITPDSAVPNACASRKQTLSPPPPSPMETDCSVHKSHTSMIPTPPPPTASAQKSRKEEQLADTTRRPRMVQRRVLVHRPSALDDFSMARREDPPFRLLMAHA